jgi:hypothetical protein
MWTARADIEQLLDRCAALAYIEQYIEGRRDISEDDHDACGCTSGRAPGLARRSGPTVARRPNPRGLERD